MVERTDPSNSDNQNGDGGGLVCACVCARVCVYACVHACVVAIYDNNILPTLIMIIIKIIFLNLIVIADTDDFSSGSTIDICNSATTFSIF